MQVFVRGLQVGDPLVAHLLHGPSLDTLRAGHMVDSAVITGMAALCNRYMGPACLPGEASYTHSRGQEFDAPNFLPALQLGEGGRLAPGVSTVLIPIHAGSSDAGHWLLARGDRVGQRWALGVYDPFHGDYRSTGGSYTPYTQAREILAGLTGLPAAAISPGPAGLPPVPPGFMQRDQVSCGVYCMVLMALWTAEAVGPPLQLIEPMNVGHARAWLATALGSNILPLWVP